MLTKRHRDERGPTNTDWLQSMHSFSFGHYMDPRHMGFGPLRVINEDHIAPGTGFSTHPHNNMEIITYVLSGELAHKDSMGNGSVIRAGDVQLMSAGSGVTHSEFNNSDETSVHLLQIWITPHTRNTEPGYQQKSFTTHGDATGFVLAVSPGGDAGSLTIRQDARVFIGTFEEGATHTQALDPKRRYWLQLAEGAALINGEEGRAGDGYAITGEDSLRLENTTATRLILFDLP